jgi:hypothetical protein
METPILNQFLTMKYFKIFNKEMNTYESRLKSFETWPVSNVQNPASLSSCGYYYFGESDRVACFYCGTGAHEWLSDDNPWVEHAIHSNKCTYLLINKSKSLQPLSVDNGIEAESKAKSSSNNLCVICQSEEAHFVLLPCSHLCLCRECVCTQDRCVICRKKIQSILKIFIS